MRGDVMNDTGAPDFMVLVGDHTHTEPLTRADGSTHYATFQEAFDAGEEWLADHQGWEWDEYRQEYWESYSAFVESHPPLSPREEDALEERLWEEFVNSGRRDHYFFEVFLVELGEDGEEILHETSDPVGPYRAASPAAEAEESPAAPDPLLQPQVDESRPYAEEAADPFERVRGEYDVEDTRPVSEQEMEDLLADLESLGIDLTSDDDDENLSGSRQKIDIGWAVLAGGVLLPLLRRE